MRNPLALCLVALMCSAAIAQDCPIPSAPDVNYDQTKPSEALSLKILGPTEVSPNVPVGLKSVYQHADSIRWALIKDGEAIPDLYSGGKYWWLDSSGQSVAFFGTDPGHYTFLLMGSGRGEMAYCLHTIRVGTPTPPPNPGPQPGPNPGPDPGPEPKPSPEPEDGEFKLAKAVYLEAVKVGQPDQAGRLAGALEGTAAAISAGTLSGPLSILKDVRTRTGSVLEDSEKPGWEPFTNLMKDRLKAHYMAGRLGNADAWAKCLREIVSGLEAAAKQ